MGKHPAKFSQTLTLIASVYYQSLLYFHKLVFHIISDADSADIRDYYVSCKLRFLAKTQPTSQPGSDLYLARHITDEVTLQ